MGAGRGFKVYGWTEFRPDFAAGTESQVRMVVAAPSKAAVGRIVNRKPAELFNLSESRNVAEHEVSLAAPGVVFYAPLNARGMDAYRAVPVVEP